MLTFAEWAQMYAKAYAAVYDLQITIAGANRALARGPDWRKPQIKRELVALEDRLVFAQATKSQACSLRPYPQKRRKR